MKYNNKVSIFTILVICVCHLDAFTKEIDEKGSYEFGFKIDGQQHRHESKDENGIIQGEFGFVTADGIYHVTVYATDENGNFKILSMKNVRISAPLDGSPGPGPEADAKSVQGGQSGQIGQKQSQPLPLQLPESTTRQTIVQQTTEAPTKKPYQFSTQPTIKPACAGCGYVTTAKPKPGEPFPFQTPAFKNNGAQGSVQGGQQGGLQQNIQKSGGFNAQDNQINYQGGKSQKQGEEYSQSQGGSFSQGGQGQSQQGGSYSQGSLHEGGRGNLGQGGNKGGSLQGENVQGQVQGGIQGQSKGGYQGSVHAQGQVGGSSQGSGQGGTQGQFQGGYGGSQGSINVQGQANLQGGSQGGLAGQGQQQGTSQGYAGGNYQGGQQGPGQSQGNAYGGQQGTAQGNTEGGLQGNLQGSGGVSGLGQKKYGGQQNIAQGQGQVQGSYQGNFGGQGNTFGGNQQGISGQGQQGSTVNQPNPLAITDNQNQGLSTLPPISVKDNSIQVGGKNPQTIQIEDKFPGMSEGLPEGIDEKDITNLLYKFKYTVGFHGHWEKGLKNGAKIGGYFVNGRDGLSRIVTYIADENGYRPKFKLVRLGLDSDEVPKEGSEKTFGLKSFEFVWYPVSN